MRLLGVARVVRAVLRRWIGGLVSVDDVNFGLRSGALELVNVELSVAKAEAALTRIGILGARVVSVRAARISISFPLSWRRGARVRLEIDGLQVLLDSRQGEAGMHNCQDAASIRAKAVAAKLDAEELQCLYSGADRQRAHDDSGNTSTVSTNTPPKVKERYWRRVARRVTESVDVQVKQAAVCIQLPEGGMFGAGFDTFLIEADTAADTDVHRWVKNVMMEGLSAYQRRRRSTNGLNESSISASDLFEEATAALRISEDVILQPCRCRARLRLSKAPTGVAALDAVMETSGVVTSSISAARCSELGEALFRPLEPTIDFLPSERLPTQDSLRAFCRNFDLSASGRWRYVIALVLEASLSKPSLFANQLLFKAKLRRRSIYVTMCKKRNDERQLPAEDATSSRWSFLLPIARRNGIGASGAKRLEARENQDRFLRSVECDFDLDALLLFRQIAAAASSSRRSLRAELSCHRPGDDDDMPSLAGDVVVEKKATETLLSATFARVRLEARANFHTTFRDGDDAPMASVSASTEARCILSLDDDVAGVEAWGVSARGEDIVIIDLTSTAPFERYASSEPTTFGERGQHSRIPFFADDSDLTWGDFVVMPSDSAASQLTPGLGDRCGGQDCNGTCVCSLPFVVIRSMKEGTTVAKSSMDLRSLDVTADWALIARLRAAAQPVLESFSIGLSPVFAKDHKVPNKKSHEHRQGALSDLQHVEATVEIRDARVVLPYDSQRDRGAMVVNYELISAKLPMAAGVLLDVEFFACPEANPETFEQIEKQGEPHAGLIGGAKCYTKNVEITEIAPANCRRDDERPLVARVSAQGIISLLRSKNLRRHIKVDVEVTDPSVKVVSSGRRLSRVLGVLETYLRLPAATAEPERWAWPTGEWPLQRSAHFKSTSGIVIDVRLSIPEARIVVLPPARSKLLNRPQLQAALIPGELVATISGIIVCSRQREEPALTRFGFRAQRYTFENAIVELLEEASACTTGTPRMLARLVEKCDNGGSFEYSAAWPPYSPSASDQVKPYSPVVLQSEGVPRPLPADALLKRLIVHSPTLTCALAEVLRAVDTVLSFLEGFRPSTCWSDDDPIYLRRQRSRNSILFDTALRRLEYVVTNYNVTLVSQHHRQPLVLCRGSTLRSVIDDDTVSFLERYGSISNFRVDAYRVATACWEPLVEPGAEVRAATATDRASGDARGIMESRSRLDIVLTRDAAAALRSLADDARNLINIGRLRDRQDPLKHDMLNSRKHKFCAPRPAVAAMSQKPKATIDNYTGCNIWLELIDGDGVTVPVPFLVIDGAVNQPLPDVAREATLYAVAEEADDITAIWRVARVLPIRGAISIIVQTLKTDVSSVNFLVGHGPDARKSFSDNDMVISKDTSDQSRSTCSPPQLPLLPSERGTSNHSFGAIKESALQATTTFMSAPLLWRSAFDELGVLRIECRTALRARNECGEQVNIMSGTGQKLIAKSGTPDEPSFTPAPLTFAASIYAPRAKLSAMKRELTGAASQARLQQSKYRCLYVGDVNGDDSVATLHLEELSCGKKKPTAWRSAAIRNFGEKPALKAHIRTRLEEDEDYEVVAVAHDRLFSNGSSAHHLAEATPVVVVLKAELVVRNTLPLPIEFCVLALEHPAQTSWRGNTDGDDSLGSRSYARHIDLRPRSFSIDLDDDSNSDADLKHDEEHVNGVIRVNDSSEEQKWVFETPTKDGGAKQIKRLQLSSLSSRASRSERVVVRRGKISSGSCTAVVEANAREYIWLAARCAVPASCRRQCTWAVAKLNAISWRRRVAAARALRQTAPMRTKAMDADARFSFSVDVEAGDETLLKRNTDLRPKQAPMARSPTSCNAQPVEAQDTAVLSDANGTKSDQNSKDEFFLGTAPAYALEVVARAPCVCIDRSGLSGGVVVGRSRVDLDAYRLEKRSSTVRATAVTRRMLSFSAQYSHRNPHSDQSNALKDAWCRARASTLSVAPSAYRVLPSTLRRIVLCQTGATSMRVAAAFDQRHLPAQPVRKPLWIFTSGSKISAWRKSYKEWSDAERHARLVWDLAAQDAAFIDDPGTLTITTSGADASSTTRRGAASWLLRLEVGRDCTIIVAFDARAERRPIWLAEGGFARRCNADGRMARIHAVEVVPGKDVNMQNARRHRFELYEKVCRAGDVFALGPLRSRGDPKLRSGTFMYAVFVIPQRRKVLRTSPVAKRADTMSLNTSCLERKVQLDGGFSEVDEASPPQRLSPHMPSLHPNVTDCRPSTSHGSDMPILQKDATRSLFDSAAVIELPESDEESSDTFYESAPEHSLCRASSQMTEADNMADRERRSQLVVTNNVGGLIGDENLEGPVDDDDYPFYDARCDEDEESNVVHSHTTSHTPHSLKLAGTLTRQQSQRNGDFLPRLSFLSSNDQFAICSTPLTRMALFGTQIQDFVLGSDTELCCKNVDSIDSLVGRERYSSFHEFRLATVAASGEPHPFEVMTCIGVAALSAVISSAPPIAGRAGRVVTLLPRYVVANSCKSRTIELAQPGLPYHLVSRLRDTFDDSADLQCAGLSSEESSDDLEQAFPSALKRFVARDGQDFVTPILRLEPGQSAALHWVNAHSPRIAKVRVLPARSSDASSAVDLERATTLWSRGGLELNSIGSQCIALRPKPPSDDKKRRRWTMRHVQNQRFSDIDEDDTDAEGEAHITDLRTSKIDELMPSRTAHSSVLRLKEATVLRVETRSRAGNGDDFATFIAIGDGADPVVVCSNETDVLVVCWQLIDHFDSADNSERSAKSPTSLARIRQDGLGARRRRRLRLQARHRGHQRQLFDTSSLKPAGSGTSGRPSSSSSGETHGLSQRWLVAPRSENEFGWCYPSKSNKIAALALANRSEIDAAVLFSGPGVEALEETAAILTVDEVGARFSLPLVDHSGEPTAPPVVLTQGWGVEAVIDMRAGSAVVRFVSHTQASFNDLLSESCLKSSPRALFDKAHVKIPTRVLAQEMKAPALSSPPRIASTGSLGVQNLSDIGSNEYSLFEYVARCSTLSISVVLDDLDDISSRNLRYFPRARRETLRVLVDGCDMIARKAQSGETYIAAKAGSTFEANVQDIRVESYACNRHLGVVLERDQILDEGRLTTQEGRQKNGAAMNTSLKSIEMEGAGLRPEAFFHFSVARQRDGNADVWRYAGARIAPMAVALDRPTLCALCAAIDALSARNGRGLPAPSDLCLQADRRQCQRWARAVRSHARAPLTPIRALASMAKFRRNLPHSNKAAVSAIPNHGASRAQEFTLQEKLGTSNTTGDDLNRPATYQYPECDAQRRANLERAGSPELVSTVCLQSRQQFPQHEASNDFSREDEEHVADLSPRASSNDGSESALAYSASELFKHEVENSKGLQPVPAVPIRSSDATTTVDPCDMLFAAFSKEPRAYVDTIELSTIRLRVTLALAARSSNDLARATLLRAGALSSAGAALLEMAAPLASLSDMSFRIAEFAARHALLTTTELRLALLTHARREAVRNAFGALGLTYAAAPTQSYLALRHDRAKNVRRDPCTSEYVLGVDAHEGAFHLAQAHISVQNDHKHDATTSMADTLPNCTSIGSGAKTSEEERIRSGSDVDHQSEFGQERLPFEENPQNDILHGQDEGPRCESPVLDNVRDDRDPNGSDLTGMSHARCEGHDGHLHDERSTEVGCLSFCVSPNKARFVQSAPCFAAMPVAQLGATLSARDRRLAGVHVILSGDAEYFCERARPRHHCRADDRETCVGSLQILLRNFARSIESTIRLLVVEGQATTTLRGIVGSLKLVADSFVSLFASAGHLNGQRESVDTVSRETVQASGPLEVQARPARRRRALAALPDGSGARRRLEPYSAVAAAAQLLAKSAFNHHRLSGATVVNEEDRDTSPLFLHFFTRSQRKRQLVSEFSEDPDSRDGEPYLDHEQLADGGLFVLAIAGVVILSKRHRRPPWVAPWNLLRIARADERTYLLTRSSRLSVTRVRRYYTDSSVVRVECSTVVAANNLREKLEQIGAVVERYTPDGSHTVLSESPLESTARTGKSAKMEDRNDEVAKFEAELRRPGELPDWVEAAVTAAAELSNTTVDYQVEQRSFCSTSCAFWPSQGHGLKGKFKRSSS